MESPETFPITSPTLPRRPRRPTRDLPARPDTTLASHDAVTPSAVPLPPTKTSVDDSKPLEEDVNVSKRPSKVDQPPVDASTLTPLRAHYLKKTLLALEFNKELTYISSSPLPPPLSVLSLLGSPFTPLPRSALERGGVQDVPFLRFVFRQFVLTFPFLATAPKDFFPSKLQPFVDSLLSRNLSSELTLFPEESRDADAEHKGTAKALAKVEKHMALLLGSAIKLAESEEVVRLTQRDLDRLEAGVRKRERRHVRSKADRFSVNVVCVRSISEKGRVRKRHHDEFVIRTRREGFDDVFVSRRYGDFRTLADELRKHHSDEDIPPPPNKDRSSSSSNGSTASTNVASRLRGAKSFPNLKNLSSTADGSNDSLPLSPTTTVAPSTPLQRERNRLSLRAYLHQLLAHSTLASSPVLRAFLTMDPIQLTEEEEMDAKRREELDAIREEGKEQFEKEVSARVDKLRDAVKDVKGDLMGPDGLTHVFGVIRTTPNAEELPSNFQAVLEWGRISLAATIFHHFIASDSGHESLQGLKRIHGLMPYFMLKGILRISNPVAMIRGVMDLFMAQPFGGRSLLQRMFTSSMTEEVRQLEEEIEAVQDKIDDPVMCEKVRQYIYAPKEIQAIYKADAMEEQANLLAVILRSAEDPALNRPQLHRVARAARAHQAYIRQRMMAEDSDDDEGPEDEDGWLFEDLAVLIRLYARLRDREQMIELIFEGTTADLLRDIITIFYAPLAQVYKAASIADSVGDLQNFLNDLIRTVEQGEEMNQEEPSRTVELFINLVSRHEQAFYHFIHKVQSKGEGLFDSLMRWVELFLTFMREGVAQDGERISLEFLLPHTGNERVGILEEIDAVALYHYRLKVAYEAKIRKRFMQEGGTPTGEELAAETVAGDVIGDLQFGSLLKGDTEDIYAEDEDEFTSDESSYEYTSDESAPDDDIRSASPSPSPAPRQSHSHIKSAPITSPDSASPLLREFSPEEKSRSSHPSPAAPPALPLPTHPSPPMKSSFDKPLPPPPPGTTASHRHSSSRRSAPSTRGSSPGKGKSRRVKRAGQGMIEPPELSAIPKLLPIFVELVRPHLWPRPVQA